MIGSNIGTYRVLRALGQGGMGTVYLAEHVLLGRRIALKVLLPSYSMDQDIVRRFFNEARAATSISDPGIVQVFDFGFHTDGSAYIVMELLEGEALDARLRRQGRLPPLDAARLIRQCAASLSAVHAQGIIHRDLKPENLFVIGDPAVTGGERLKILDFGIAKLLGGEVSTSRTRTGVLIGTPIYMSPEQCRGMGEVGFRSDMYSLGGVLFALLAGRPPFVHDSSGELIVAHLKEPPPSLSDLVPGIPRLLDEVVQRCLAKSPADRYISMQSLAHALDVVIATALGASATSASRPRPVALGSAVVTTLRTANGQLVVSLPAPAPLPRRRSRVIAVTAAVAIVLGFGAVALYGRGEQDPAAQPSITPAASTTPRVVPAAPVAPAARAGSQAPAVILAEPPVAVPRRPAVTIAAGHAKPRAVPPDAGVGDALDAAPAAASPRTTGTPVRVHRSTTRPPSEVNHAEPATKDAASLDPGDD